MVCRALLLLIVMVAGLALGAGCPRSEVKPRDPSVLVRACERARRMCTPKNWMKCASDRFDCHRLGLWHETGYRGLVAKDLALSKRIFGEMCDRADVLSCQALCRKHKVVRRCVDRDLLALSGQGTPRARMGHAVPRSRILSFYAPTFTRACGRGDLVACIVLGIRFDPLRSITSRRLGNCYDDKQRCFVRACQVGAPLACAVMCHLGHKPSCVDLATLVLGDHGMKSQKFKKASALLGKLCRAGQLRACTVLGVALLQGMPLIPDRSRAVKLLQRACHGGYERACSQLRRLPPSSR